MKRMRRQTLAVVLVVALGGWQPFRAADPDVVAGNDAYAAGRYDEAIAAYARAEERGAVDPDGLAYDRGTAELAAAGKLGDAAAKQALTQQGFEHLKQAAHAKDAQVRGAAHYNTGNALLGANKLDDAIEAYKDALREDPRQDDARVNLEVALRRKQKQGGGGQGQGQPGQGQPGQGQQGQQPQQGSGAGSGQPPQGSGAGSGQPPQGSGAGSGPPPQGSGAGSGQAPQPQSGSGAGSGQAPQPQSGSGAGSGQAPPPQPGSGAGQGSQQPQGSAAGGQAQPQQGSGGQGPGAQGPQAPNGSDANHVGKPQHGGRGAHGGESPRTPTDRKLDDLEDYSRRMQRDEARRHATGHAPDPDHDW